MTDASEFACPKCGAPVEIRREGSTQGLFCTNCDWSVVTTYLPEILNDTSKYVVRVLSGDFKNDQHLRIVAQLAGVNLITSRKMLQGGGFVLFTGLASKVSAVRDTLESVGLVFEIEPPFPW